MADSYYTTLADSNYTTMVDSNFTTMANRNITTSSDDTEGKYEYVLIPVFVIVAILLGVAFIIWWRKRKGGSTDVSEPDPDMGLYSVIINRRHTGRGEHTTNEVKDKSADVNFDFGKPNTTTGDQTTNAYSIDEELMLESGTPRYVPLPTRFNHKVTNLDIKIQRVIPLSQITDLNESPSSPGVERLTSNGINDVHITRSLPSTSSVAFSNVEGQSSTSRIIIREITNKNDVTFQHESYQRTLSKDVVSNAASTSNPDQPTEAGYHENFASVEANSEVSGNEVDINNALGNSDASEKQIVASITSENDDCNEHLDWNKIFLFAVKIIPPMTWKLFFVQLFGHINHSPSRVMDINSIIEHKELKLRGDLPTLFYDLFVEWHKSMGAKACPTMIQSSLEGIGDTLSQKKFNDFIRDPPKILSNPRPLCNNGNQITPIVPLPTTCGPVMALYSTDSDFETSDGIAIPRPNREELYFHKSTTVSGIFTNSQRFGSVAAQSFCESQQYRERDISGMDTSFEDGKTPRKRRKLTNQYNSGGFEKQNKRVNNKTVKRKRTDTKKRRRNSDFPTKCEELVKWETINHYYVIKLIKSLMQTDSAAIGEKEYNLFLHHTVNTLMEETGESEEIILTLLLGNYENKHSLKAKSGNLTVMMETDSKWLCLKKKTWECLNFYVEKPRTRIVQHQLQKDAKFKDSAFVFIDYFGNPLLGQESSVGDQTRNEARVVNKITTQTEMVGKENNEENQPTYGNREKESCANTDSTHDEVRNDDMTTEACAKGNTNTDCVIDETHLGNNVHENEDVEDIKYSSDEENVNKSVAGYNNMQNEDNGDKIIEHKGSFQVNDESVEKVGCEDAETDEGTDVFLNERNEPDIDSFVLEMLTI